MQFFISYRIVFWVCCFAFLQTSAQVKPVQDKSFIDLGGEKQYVEITGQSAENPVLLFLHGGPGWPQTPHLRYFNSELTKYVTVVAWEQSGCGKSYMNNPQPKKLSIDQIMKDAHQLTQLLKARFHKQKIYLVGFSWGSIIGLKLAELYPQDYIAYFGITQVIDLRKSIVLSREWIRQQAAKKKDTATLNQLVRISRSDPSVCKRPMDCFLAQYQLLNKYHGAIYKEAMEAEILKAETMYPDYKKYDWYTAFKYSAYRLEHDLFASDLSGIRKIDIPVYFFLGRHDWNLPTAISIDFLSKLSCPKKEAVWFEQSGHEPLEEEAASFNREMIKRLR